MKILVIEDDRQTASYVVGGMREEGHDLDHASNGPNGLELAVTRDYDVLVIDRMLPGLDGLSIVRALRSSGKDTPVLFLTSIGGVDDRVEGLEAGGDDYLLKPFAFSELMARVNALGRRAPSKKEETVLRVGGLEMNLIARTVTRDGQTIELQPREFQLLEYLMRNRGRVLTRTMLLERVWDFHFDPKTNVVETHISRLRSKVDKPFEKEMIRTVRGAGYALHAPS
ncbi:winged helix-turn-helix domain-containing protein [Aureimonas glaciei]|jgi:two-component system OmpR family response regulator|uniref:DNA-binding response regulator n=1 Tax=Aureimonas glaciei TaxID=1776957 RepID=A0A916XVW4_9HYPH|nr:winged helix-turn-helix domain-containing protein [Aureimonas glaciei]GGD15838.1 DNA-binding response regulator [Aureimonas glaciei]